MLLVIGAKQNCFHRFMPRKKSVFVIDRGTYDTVLNEEDRRPVTSWNKIRLCNRTNSWGGAPDDWILS